MLYKITNLNYRLNCKSKLVNTSACNFTLTLITDVLNPDEFIPLFIHPLTPPLTRSFI